MPRSVIHRVKEVSFSVGGSSYDVASIDMTLMPNALPMIKVSVAPESGGKASASGSSSIHALSLESLSSALNELIEKAARNEEASLHVSVEAIDASSGGKDKDQVLDISGWILIGAGLGNVTTTNTFSMECTIAHPVYKLAMHGGFYSNLFKRMELKKVSSSITDPIDAGIKAYREIIDKSGDDNKYILSNGGVIQPPSKPPDGILSDAQAIFDEVPGIIASTLEWVPSIGGGNSSLPCASYMSLLIPGLKYAVCNAWLNATRRGGSVWDSFQDMTSLFGLSMIPDYTKERLPVTPYFPWVPPTITINEDDGYHVSFPGSDPSPIYGTAGVDESNGGFVTTLSTYDRTWAEKTGKDAGMLAFVPESGANVNGAFVGVSFPGWLTSALHLAAQFAEIGLTAFADSPLEPDPAQAGENLPVGCLVDAKMAYLSYIFSVYFKKRLEASLGCPLMFTAGEAPIIPGYVAEYKAGGSTLFEGTLVSVTHHIDMASSSGTTSLHFGWCRPGGGYDITNKYGGVCPIYS